MVIFEVNLVTENQDVIGLSSTEVPPGSPSSYEVPPGSSSSYEVPPGSPSSYAVLPAPSSSPWGARFVDHSPLGHTQLELT